MAYNFISSDRDQMYLLPPDMRDWLPENYLLWFIMEIVSHLDLTPFYQRYNPKKEGRVAYNPSIMTALYFYSYCTGVRSSRKIEQLCIESVPFRIISGDHHSDHTTINRFRKNFATELAGLFIQVLTICYESGLCNVSTVSVDGTKIKADASMASNRTESGLKKDIKIYFKEADQEDAREGRLRRLKEVQEESTGKKKRGRKPRSAEQVEKEETEKLKANITDPDSRIMKTRKARRDGKIIPLPLTPVSTMEYKLLTPEGRKLYKKRSATIEPVFGHIKEVLGFNRFMRRGLDANVHIKLSHVLIKSEPPMLM